MSERTFHQISQQYEAQHQQPSVLVRRHSSGEIQTARLTHMSDKEGRRYVEFYDEAEGEDMFKAITSENLSDTSQERLAKELAESAERNSNSWERVSKVQESLARTALSLADTKPSLDSKSEVVSVEQKTTIKLKQENIERSKQELDRALGGELGRMIKAVSQDESTRREVIDPNSGDAKLRRDVEALLRQRVDDLGYKQLLPERVQSNSSDNLKNIPSSRFGYEKEKYLSRDYAAKLALAMLDGSFDGDPRKIDYDDLPVDDPRNGQHRQAARMVIDSFAQEKNRAQGGDVDKEGESHLLGEIKTILHQLHEDETFSRVNVLIRELDEEYGRGLPEFFETDQVSEQLQRCGVQVQDMDEAISQTQRRIISVVEQESAYEDHSVIEQIQGDISSTQYDIEAVRQVISMLVGKVDELAYDPGAQLEVRSLFAQQLPQVIYDLERAVERIRSLTE